MNETIPSTDVVEESNNVESVNTESSNTESQTNINTPQQNWDNGKRRIQQRQSAKARIRELEERLAQYEGKDDDYSRFQSEQLQDRIADMSAITNDDDVAAYAELASTYFGKNTDAFMEKMFTYAPYVNSNEPDLLRYCNREYGPILLYEWMHRMDNPQLRAQWLQMTPYEKGKVLDNFYQQIGAVIKQQRNNMPVPNSGRQSPSDEPTDDFGIELAKAINRHKR